MGIFPFPSSALLTILQLDFLHGSDKLVGFVVIDGLLLEQFIVQYFSTLQEQGHPSSIENTSQQENSEHQFVVEEQHYREDYESKHCKGNVECLLCEKVIYTAMVAHSLHQVSHEFRVKERHRQLQEFNEEVAHQ